MSLNARSRVVIVVVLLAAAVLGAYLWRGKGRGIKQYVEVGEYISPEDSFPRVRYFDSNQVSINDRCAVRKARLNLKMPPVYVNGQPVGFC